MGIGRAISQELADAGWNVALSYRQSEREAEKTCFSIHARGHRALAVRADVTDARQVRRLLRQVQKELGSIQVLVNNVGEYTEGPLGSMSIEDWKWAFDSNLHSAFLCARETLSGMRRLRWGRIINITASCTENHPAAPGAGAYHAAKEALLSFTRSLALEEIRHGITVNAVGPGLTDNEHLGAKWEKAMTRLSPLGRMVEPHEVARAVAFLASKGSEAITGAHLAVGGGWNATGGGRPDASLMRILSRRPGK